MKTSVLMVEDIMLLEEPEPKPIAEKICPDLPVGYFSIFQKIWGETEYVYSTEFAYWEMLLSLLSR